MNGATPNRDRSPADRSILRLSGAAVVAALVVAATTLGLTPRLIIAASVGLPSLVLMIMSRRELGDAFAVRPKAKALVTTGLYARIQHPMYTFLDLFLAALITASGWPLLLCAWGVLAVVQVIRARQEEKLLSAAFGADYEAYRRTTWC